MSTFAVGFSRPKKSNPFSSLIMKFMGTSYSHTYLLFDVNSTGQKVVYQANRHGVICLEYENFKAANVILDEIHILPENRASALSFCISNLGKSYSLLAVFAILLNIKFGDGTKHFICSELVARALDLKVNNLDTITPREIREILECK